MIAIGTTLVSIGTLLLVAVGVLQLIGARESIQAGERLRSEEKYILLVILVSVAAIAIGSFLQWIAQ